MNNALTKTRIKNDHHEDYTYVWEPQALNAVKAAVLINRPLLVRGEPGSGKSQLAKAAASYLERCFIPYVVSAKTESQNLLWSFDAVARLADAQIEGALCKSGSEKEIIREKLELKNYIQPEALWAALDWGSAKAQFDAIAINQGKNPSMEGYECPLKRFDDHQQAEAKGVVVLIDEIDKADSSLPNGLLEVLGSNRFHPDGLDSAIELQSFKSFNQYSRVKRKKKFFPLFKRNDSESLSNSADSKKGTREFGAKFANTPPLIIVTTNDEHPLPDAFVRRCLVVDVGLPEEDKQKKYLVSHATPNFKDLEFLMVKDNDGNAQSVLEAVADQVIDDRKEAKLKNIRPLIGQAEYFDLLRGINALAGNKESNDDIRKWITTLANFSSQKGQKKSPDTFDLPRMGSELNGQ